MRLAVLTVFCLFLSLAKAETVGYVVALTGTWTATPGSAKLSPGQAIGAGAKLAGAGRITIAFLDGSAKTFDAPFTAQTLRQAQDSGTARMAGAVLKAFERGKRPPVFAVSRGSGGPEPAVLKLAGKRLDVAPAFRGFEAGAYPIELRDLSGTVFEGNCNYEPPPSTSVSVAGLTPGMYTMRVMNGSGAFAGTAAVLVTGPAEFEAKTKLLEQARQVTAGWPKDIDPAAKSYFLAAALLELSAQ